MNGSNLAGGNPRLQRIENDFYATNPQDTQNFLNEIKNVYILDNKTILEPASGEGHIVNVLKENFPNSIITATDLIQRNNQEVIGGIDFLNSYNKGEKYDYVITNPPFVLAKEFIDKSLTLSNVVFMFAKLQFLEGKARKEWLKSLPLKYVYVYSYRANPWRNGSPVDDNGKKYSSTMAFAWYVFDKNYVGEPIIRWV